MEGDVGNPNKYLQCRLTPDTGKVEAKAKAKFISGTKECRTKQGVEGDLRNPNKYLSCLLTLDTGKVKADTFNFRP